MGFHPCGMNSIHWLSMAAYTWPRLEVLWRHWITPRDVSFGGSFLRSPLLIHVAQAIGAIQKDPVRPVFYSSAVRICMLSMLSPGEPSRILAKVAVSPWV